MHFFGREEGRREGVSVKEVKQVLSEKGLWKKSGEGPSEKTFLLLTFLGLPD